jgi:general stress protein YciG
MDKSRGGSESEMNESRGGSRGGSGNFADDPEKASEAGKKGGEHSHSRTSHGGK